MFVTPSDLAFRVISSFLLSWRVTLLRKAKLHRIEVEYSGRRKLLNYWLFCVIAHPLIAAIASETDKANKPNPPFMAILHSCR